MKKPIPKNNNQKLLKHYPRISLIAISIFLILLALLHLIEPEFEPSKHLISEYELGRFGVLMSLAFFSLAIGVHTMVLSTWSYTNNKVGLIGKYFFLLITVALFGAGIFYPNVIPYWTSKIHTICGMIVIFTFPIASTLYSIGITPNQNWKKVKLPVIIATCVVWIGFLTFIGSLLVFSIKNNLDKAILTIGWQNRLMIFSYCLWLLIIAFKAMLLQNRLNKGILINTKTKSK